MELELMEIVIGGKIKSMLTNYDLVVDSRVFATYISLTNTDKKKQIQQILMRKKFFLLLLLFNFSA